MRDQSPRGGDDDDLKDYINGTIRRLERLAARLETYVEENKDEPPIQPPEHLH